jgi:uncharacterized protein (DUF58 family)
VEDVALKINIKGLIGYILTFALMLFLFWFNHRRIILFFIVAMVMYLVTAIIMLRRNFPIPEMRLTTSEANIRAGERITIICNLSYDHYFPFSKIDVLYKLGHRNQDNKFEISEVYNIFHGANSYSFDIRLDYCGIYEIKCEHVYFYDLLGIFARKIKELPSADAIVLPKAIEVFSEIKASVLDDEEDIYSDPSAGTDVSEIKELREYREGDRLSQVHWKLSTKSEDLVVKEYARQAGVNIVIACDGSYTDLKSLTAYFELLSSIGMSLLADEEYFELAYLSASAGDLINVRVDNSYDLNIAISDMYYNMLKATTIELEEFYKMNSGKSNLLYLTADELDDRFYNQLVKYKDSKLYAAVI